MKRDLYAEVSARIVAELEAGAAPWVKPWSATPGANTPCNAVSNRPYSGCNVVLLWMAQAAGYRTPRFLTFKQALELGGNVRKGEHGTKVYFVKQLQVRDQGADDSSSTRLIPMMREYTVFNVEQCDNLPDSISTGKPIRVRNPDTRDELADAFLHSTCADICEGSGEAYFVPSRDFISAGIRRVQGRGSLLQRSVPRINALVRPQVPSRSRFEEPVRLTELRGRGTDSGVRRRFPLCGVWLRRGRQERGLYQQLDWAFEDR
jgi:antirestriction protein ArdC